jgi:hypothetical protein
MGGESTINETVGLGRSAQAAALQRYYGGSPESMVLANLKMYEITVAEHLEYGAPFLGFHGVPRRARHRAGRGEGDHALPRHRSGGQIRAGSFDARPQCLASASAVYRDAHGAAS